MEQSELIERLARIEAVQKDFARRLTADEEKLEDIHELTTSVKLIAQQNAQIERKQDELAKAVEELRAEPGKKYMSLRAAIVSAFATLVIGTVGGYFLQMILK